MEQNKSANLLIGLGAIWVLLAVGLAIYQLTYTPTIQVDWQTATELNTVGFQLYRSTSPEGEFVLITDEIIPSEGSSVSGGSYTFIDDNIQSGVEYYYLLEEIEDNGRTIQFSDEIISRSVPSINMWVWILIIVIVVAGMLLLGFGFREKERGFDGSTTT